MIPGWFRPILGLVAHPFPSLLGLASLLIRPPLVPFPFGTPLILASSRFVPPIRIGNTVPGHHHGLYWALLLILSFASSHCSCQRAHRFHLPAPTCAPTCLLTCCSRLCAHRFVPPMRPPLRLAYMPTASSRLCAHRFLQHNPDHARAGNGN